MTISTSASAAPTSSGIAERPGDGAAAMISARHLTRRFGERVAVDDLTLDVPARETFGLLGANGAGKTTFIRMVTGVLLPSEGEVSVDGVSPARDPAAVQKHIGFVMETSRLYPELRVQGFLRFVAGARDLAGENREEAVDRVIERFQLDAVADRMIGNLSKGYQQRVSLAQAFVHDPKLVIVDEPTGGLDPVQQNEVQSVLAALRGECTVVLCTHDLAEARRLASTVAVLNAGRLVAHGPTQDVLGDESDLALFRGEETGEEETPA